MVRVGAVEHAVTLTEAQARTLGRDGSLWLAYLEIALSGLAAVRSGVWDKGTEAAREPDADDWASVISALSALNGMGEALMAAAVREHAALGGTVEQLGEAMGRPKGTAQNRRQRWIGTREQPINPGAPEMWARGVGPAPSA